jgi:hypothetical protein
VSQFVVSVLLPENSTFKPGAYYRELCIKLADATLPPLLFWRNENSQEITERPQVRWIGKRGGFNIVGSFELENDLKAAAIEIMSVFQRSGKRCMVEFGEYASDALENLDGLNEYQINSMVYDVGVAKTKAFVEADTATQKSILQAFVESQLFDECQCWGIDADPLTLAKGHIRISNIRALSTIKISGKDGNVVRVMPRFALTLTMPVKLKGSWQVGRLLNKGHGVIKPAGRRK